MFHGQAGPVYLAAFFLDIRFGNSDVFSGHGMNSARTPTAAMDLSSDNDVWCSLPAYTLAGTYLVKLLACLYNKDPNCAPFSHYASWPNIQIAFQRQLLSFTRGLSPFDGLYIGTQTGWEFWQKLLSVPSADLLAKVGLLLASIVPNSMAEERTMSTITKFNSPDQVSQKVSTLIDMVTIRQHYKREEAVMSLIPRSLRPTVRFADLTPAARLLTPENIAAEGGDSNEATSTNTGRPGNKDEAVPAGTQQYFEVEREDGIFLASKVLFEALFDHPNSVQKVGRPIESSQPPEPVRKRQRVNVDTVVF